MDENQLDHISLNVTSERERLKHLVNIEIAEAVARLSTCKYLSVGAVLVEQKNNRIISTGYNGTSFGQKHCRDIQMTREEHREWSERNEIHAELNLILNAAKNGISTNMTDLYSTVSPCWNCLKHIKNAGITRVFYRTKYWRLSEGEIESQEIAFGIPLIKI